MTSKIAEKINYLCLNYKGISMSEELYNNIIKTIEEEEEKIRELYQERIRKILKIK